MVVYILKIPFDSPLEELERLRSLLPEKYAGRAVKPEVIYAHALLGYAFREIFGKGFTIEYAESGKPYIPDRSEINFSLSHTPGCAMCAVGGEKVGVDVERLRPFPYKRVLNLMDERELFGLDDREKLLVWTKKESYVKMTGGSISAMGDIRFYGDEVSAPEGIYFKSYSCAQGYAAGICALSPPPENPIMVNPEKILEI